ncbi:site-specific integrase [Colwellia sp. Arc7-D]|uniref:site-specific integrase n=1 Tax=Colwellia sp. Arc7-D TaxID=2161872 RepID=UPI0013A58E53|nr:site-specific integrase [Colwellia sp. Arc7-D]
MNKVTLTFKDIDKFKETLIEDGNQQILDVFTILLRTGLRLPLILNIEFEHINFDSGEIWIDTIRKGGLYKSQVNINSECLDLFKRLRQLHPHDKFVFQSRKSNYQKNKEASPISRQSVNKAFKSASNKVSVPITSNSLRQAFLVNILKENFSEGNDSIELASIIGHEKKTLTINYKKPEDTELKSDIHQNNSCSTFGSIFQIKTDSHQKSHHEVIASSLNYNALFKAIETLSSIYKIESVHTLKNKYNVTSSETLIAIDVLKKILLTSLTKDSRLHSNKDLSKYKLAR